MAATKRITIPWRSRHWIWLLLFFIIISGWLSFLLAFSDAVAQEVEELRAILPRPLRLGPVYTKGIYISSWTASEDDQIDELINFILRTELNAVVIDIKDSSGKITYASEIDQAKKWETSEIRIKDLNALLCKFQNKGIYTIARVVIFRDPVLAQKRPDLALMDERYDKAWQDYGGTEWVDPASEEVWEYNVALAREALEKGFEEINFDYVRFPSGDDIRYIDYPIWDLQEPRTQVIQRFFKYQAQELASVGRRSIDLFGMTMWHSDTDYDMNIGQRLIDALPYFDYISPMLYPSHFIDAFEDLDNPAEYPYEVISRSFEKAKILLSSMSDKITNMPKIRPWLQAFNMGAVYDQEMIQKQKQAVADNGGYGWFLWNARNDYFSIEKALNK